MDETASALASSAVSEGKLATETADGHTLVVKSLKSLGVTHVYSVSGTPIRETLAACIGVGVRPIGVRNQQAGVMMAIAQNYIAGRMAAVALLSAGPAVTNAVTSVLLARDNCWPVVVLGSRRPLSMRGMGSFQDLDAVPIFHSITKWSALVETTASIPCRLEQAFNIAADGRPGPVYLDIPEDVLTGLAYAYEQPQLNCPRPPSVDESAILRSADILHQAKRPGLIIGKGVRWSEPFSELDRLATEFGIPFIASPMGRGFLSDDHPLCCNAARGMFQSQADVLLVVGARLDWTFRFGGEFAPDVKIIQVDIHQPQIGVNIIPAVGIRGDAKDVLARIVAHLEKKPARNDKLARWHFLLARAKAAKLSRWDGLMESDAVPMSPYRMLREVREFLPRDAVCILDGNVFMAAAQQILPSYLPLTRFTAGSDGCMGVGIPFGIGAKIAQPGRPVVVICGDTAFGFSAMEMETAVRHRIPIIVLVVNNEGNCGALMQTAHFPADWERVTMFQPDIRYEQFMQAFGGFAEYVDEPEQLRPALDRAASSGVAACINVKVDPAFPYPRD